MSDEESNYRMVKNFENLRGERRRGGCPEANSKIFDRGIFLLLICSVDMILFTLDAFAQKCAFLKILIYFTIKGEI